MEQDHGEIAGRENGVKSKMGEITECDASRRKN